MRKAPLVLVLIPLILSASAIEAKNREKAWELGGLAAHIDGDSDSGVDNAIGWELRIGYNISDRIESELVIQPSSGETFGRDASYLRTTLNVTGNFLTDRETPWIPYITAGLGVITMTIDATTDSLGNEVLESYDSAGILTLGVGTRYFWSDNWGARVEARYNHHDAFSENQDEYVLALGVTWLLGGAK
ncbi:MAG: outer membrane protein [Candidatus Polarisedimenticolia bacterium]